MRASVTTVAGLTLLLLSLVAPPQSTLLARSNATTRAGKLPTLFAIVRTGNLQALDQALRKDRATDLNVANRRGQTLLMFALGHRQYAMAGRLLEAGADPLLKSAPVARGTKPETARITPMTYIRKHRLWKLYRFARSEVLEVRLRAAVRQGQLDRIKRLLDAGARANRRYKHRPGLAYEALQYNQAAALRLLVKRGLRISSNRSLCQVAAQKHSPQLMQLLVELGYSLRSASRPPFSLLGWAVGEGYPGAASFLLKRGANPNTTTGRLLERASDKDHRDRYGHETVLYYAITTGNRPMQELLLKHGANPNKRSHSGRPLQLAVRRGDLAAVRLLLQHSVNVNAGRGYRDTALIPAIRHQEWRIVDLLIERGARVDVSDAQHWALHAAVHTGRARLVQRLIKKGARVNRRDRRGRTALHCATALYLSGAIERDVIVALLRAGPDLELGDRQGMTPLMLAARGGNRLLVQDFLRSGASANRASSAGTTALLLAVYGERARKAKAKQTRTSGHVEEIHDLNRTRKRRAQRLQVLRLLLDHGAQVDRPGHLRRTALWWAAYLGRERVAIALLRRGANVNAADKGGQTPLDAAYEARRPHMRRILFRYGPKS